MRALAVGVPKASGDAMFGIYVHEPEDSRMWAKFGFRLRCVSFDGRFLPDVPEAALSAAKKGTRGEPNAK